VQRRIVVLVVLFAIVLGLGVVGIRTSADGSAPSILAGLSQTTVVDRAFRPVEAPAESARGLAALVRGITLLAAVVAVAYAVFRDRSRSVLQWERLVVRGPPSSRPRTAPSSLR
jgi:hypothetical protein